MREIERESCKSKNALAPPSHVPLPYMSFPLCRRWIYVGEA